ncbi:hypothetical protein GCM10009804_35670 [Kribbella hippodromi]|uniref:Uncharacterized protein n=1 Tax=Kribbella hippodromi TaxID=434347 RepID=A0ABN2DEQ2_9ACTN
MTIALADKHSADKHSTDDGYGTHDKYGADKKHGADDKYSAGGEYGSDASSGGGAVVRVRWKVGGLDDLTLLGVGLGVLPKDRVLMDGAVIYRPSDGTAMGSSPKLTEYLLRRITVTSHGKDCPGAVQLIADLAKSGASIEYTCPSAVGAVAVTVKTLTDLNPAYKTLATGPDGARAVYGDGNDQHEWNLGTVDTKHLGRSALLQLGAVAAAVLLAAAAIIYIRRRRPQARPNAPRVVSGWWRG